jgi:hypothetical protein
MVDSTISIDQSVECFESGTAAKTLLEAVAIINKTLKVEINFAIGFFIVIWLRGNGRFVKPTQICATVLQILGW